MCIFWALHVSYELSSFSILNDWFRFISNVAKAGSTVTFLSTQWNGSALLWYFNLVDFCCLWPSRTSIYVYSYNFTQTYTQQKIMGFKVGFKDLGLFYAHKKLMSFIFWAQIKIHVSEQSFAKIIHPPNTGIQISLKLHCIATATWSLILRCLCPSGEYKSNIRCL